MGLQSRRERGPETREFGELGYGTTTCITHFHVAVVTAREGWACWVGQVYEPVDFENMFFFFELELAFEKEGG